jgi:hypothetical protein
VLCSVTGGLNLFTEMVAFFYIVWFSYLVKRMVSSPTSNFQSLTLLAHVLTYLLATVFTVSIALTFGFGLSVSVEIVTPLVNFDLWNLNEPRKISR